MSRHAALVIILCWSRRPRTAKSAGKEDKLKSNEIAEGLKGVPRSNNPI